MKRTTLHTDQAPAAVGPYSQAVRWGDLLFVSGQIGIDPQTGTLTEGLKQQTEQVIQNLSAVCVAAGTELRHAVKLTVYLTNMSAFATINDILGRHFADEPPARATVEVSALPLKALVEMDAIVPVVD